MRYRHHCTVNIWALSWIRSLIWCKKNYRVAKLRQNIPITIIFDFYHWWEVSIYPTSLYSTSVTCWVSDASIGLRQGVHSLWSVSLNFTFCSSCNMPTGWSVPYNWSEWACILPLHWFCLWWQNETIWTRIVVEPENDYKKERCQMFFSLDKLSDFVLYDNFLHCSSLKNTPPAPYA